MSNTVKELLAVLKGMDPTVLTGLRVAIILVGAWVVGFVLRRLIRLFRERFVSSVDDVEAIKRAETLARVLRHSVTVVVSLVGGTLVLGEIGISAAPILGAAGVVGIAVGFGAQSLVKDYFAGFCILIENQIRQGDVVDIVGKSGLVEEITLRYVRLRDYEGNVHFIPNGLITTVTNRTRGYSNSVIDFSVDNTADVDAVFVVMRETATALAADPNFASKILGPLEIAGVENWSESALMIRCRIKVVPTEQPTVRREYLRRLKKAFEGAGIEIPSSQLTIFTGHAKNRAVVGSGPEPTAQS